jgi:hypothetical protein
MSLRGGHLDDLLEWGGGAATIIWGATGASIGADRATGVAVAIGGTIGSDRTSNVGKDGSSNRKEVPQAGHFTLAPSGTVLLDMPTRLQLGQVILDIGFPRTSNEGEPDKTLLGTAGCYFIARLTGEAIA